MEHGDFDLFNSRSRMAELGFDAVALKPTEIELPALSSVPLDRIILDYEGPDAFPNADTLDRLAALADLRVTVPVRADGFDPLGDDCHWTRIPSTASVALVAGNPAYLSTEECRRPIAPRLAAALERVPEAWVGTESIEPIAVATGATQFELLARETEQRVRSLKAAGLDADIALYAPAVLDDDTDALLDTLGQYVARRQSIAEALPADATPDASARGPARQHLLSACEDYAIVGDAETVRQRINDLRSAGLDHIVGYPARGLENSEAEP
jgi:hypothetical protein